MSTKMPEEIDEAVVLPRIPLETFRNFFCLGGQDGTQNGSSGLLGSFPPSKVKELVSSIFAGYDLSDHKAEWNEHILADTTRVGLMVSNQQNFFLHARFEKDGVGQHVMISGRNISVVLEGITTPIFEVHSIFCGNETADGNMKCTTCLCRSYVDDDEKEDLVLPITDNEYYAFLCYMRFILGCCVADDEINLGVNVAWFTPPLIEDSQSAFNELLGRSTIGEVKAFYFGFKNETLEASTQQYDHDEDVLLTAPPAPHRILQ